MKSAERLDNFEREIVDLKYPELHFVLFHSYCWSVTNCVPRLLERSHFIHPCTVDVTGIIGGPYTHVVVIDGKLRVDPALLKEITGNLNEARHLPLSVNYDAQAHLAT